MTRAAQFVAAAVAVAFGIGAWRVLDSAGSALPPDRVPIVVEDDLIQVGGSLGDFDVAGDRMILVLGKRVLVGRLGAAGDWATVGASPPADDGVIDVDVLDGRWAVALRGANICTVDLAADGPVTWDGCQPLALPAVHMMGDGAWSVVELQDGGVTVFENVNGALRRHDPVFHPAVAFSGFALVGRHVVILGPGGELCAYALPDGAPLNCATRTGVNGLYAVGDRVAAYTATAIQFDRPDALADAPASTLPLAAPPTTLSGGHGVLGLQTDGELAIVTPGGAAPVRTTHSIEGRLGGVAVAGHRTCWSRALGRGDRAYGGIRCVDGASGRVLLSLVTPGIVEHALQVDGRLALVDATVGVGLVDLDSSTITLLSPGGVLRTAHGLDVSDDEVAVALGDDGIALMKRPLRDLSEKRMLWRNDEPWQAVSVAMDGPRVIAADSSGSIFVADRATGASTQLFEVGGFPLEITPSTAGVFVSNRDNGLSLMTRTPTGDYTCCTTVLTGVVTDVALENGRMAIARGPEGVTLASLEDAAAGRIDGPVIPTAGTALGVAWLGDRVVVAEANGYVEVFDAPPGGAVARRGLRWVGGVPERVWPNGAGLVVASEFGGVTVVPDVTALALDPNARPPDVDAGIAMYEPLDLAAAIGRGDVIAIDVRRPEEFAQEHIPGARSVPLSDVPRFVAETDLGATTVVPYCMKDFRGYAAISLLQTSGAPRIGAIDGFGLAAWKAAKLPLAGTTGGMDDAAALEALQKEIDGR